MDGIETNLQLFSQASDDRLSNSDQHTVYTQHRSISTERIESINNARFKVSTDGKEIIYRGYPEFVDSQYYYFRVAKRVVYISFLAGLFLLFCLKYLRK